MLPINTLLAARWSGRAYDPQREITTEQIMTLLEAARWSPSCFGDQPWRFIICNRFADDTAWSQALSCLTEGNQQWAQHAPLLLLVLADTLFSHNDQENRWGQYDTGAAAMSVCIQASELGLMAHQMGGIVAEKIVRLFNVPERYIPMSAMALGYQLPREDIPLELLERELGERKRRPLGELFFRGTWGRGMS